VLALVLFSILVSACDQAAQQPIAFPKRAYLGETVSVAIDTDSRWIGSKKFTLSKENVVIQLWDQQTQQTHNVVPRAVIVGSAGPDALPQGFTTPPSLVWIYPLFYPPVQPPVLEPINESMFPELQILGPAVQGSGPTTFVPSVNPPTDMAERTLEPLPALRLRARRPQFQPPSVRAEPSSTRSSTSTSATSSGIRGASPPARA
jgi:hypothetical protein